MHRRYNRAHLILDSVVVLGLTLLMVCVDAQARIAFKSDRDGNSEIYVMDADGGNLQRLTNHPDSDFHPSWSPDGKWIAFLSRRDQVRFKHGITAEIYVMDAGGGNPQRLTNNPHADYCPSWSPDGKQIAFASVRDGNADIYVMDADGGNQKNLTNNPLYDYSPSWSPDGERIVFTARRDGHFRKDLDLTYEIYVMDADGGNEQRLTENRKYDFSPSWSPDGKRIAFASDRKGDFVNYEIYVMDADGRNQRKLTNNRHDDWYPSWSPDGKRIAFASERDGNWEIYVMDDNGENQKNLTNNRNRDDGPAWFNLPFSVSPAGKKFTMWGRFKQVNQ